MEANIAPRPVDHLRGKCPGPILLTVRRRNVALVLVACVALAVFCAYILISGRASRTYDMVMAPIAVVFFSVVALRSLILLVMPSTAALKLDAEGFEICRIFVNRRFSWREVDGFRVERKARDKHGIVTYDLLTADAHGGLTKATRTLPGNYGLSTDDLAWLMARWREDALQHQEYERIASWARRSQQ